jgi:hypothetical protein
MLPISSLRRHETPIDQNNRGDQMKEKETSQELTLKQRKFVRGYLQGKPLVQAATEAGYAPSTAARGATELLRSEKVRTTIQVALEKAGVTDELLATTIREGMAAQKASHLVHEGEIKTVEAVDWHARHRFVDTALRLKNAYPGQGLEAGGETWEELIFRVRARLVKNETESQAEQPAKDSRDSLRAINDGQESKS